MSILYLPRQLQGRPFTVREALDLGLTHADLGTLRLPAPTRGVRTEAQPGCLGERCAAFATVMDGDFAFSHLTSGGLHRLPGSTAMDADPTTHIIRRSSEAHVRRRGVRGHRGYECRAIEEVDGLPVVGLTDTWVDMGELVGPGLPVGLDDLIVMGDAIATRLRSVEPLRQALATRVRPRGKLTLLEALESVRVGSESPAETRTRLVLVRGGLPEPILNDPIRTRSGVFVGRPDMKYKNPVRIAVEVQGHEFHSGSEERVCDEARYADFGKEGYEVVPVWSDDANSDAGRSALVLNVAQILCFPRSRLTLDECAPRFFSRRMLELAELRKSRRARGQ
ncbi:MAG: hypothetical protein L0H79_18475 [Intrasporangium sp.]|uniref:hypothetical protein n=1 Tax=Intrasporangium sp. TaxID=1925024 RepID=UPI002647FB2C|nr:hypothetical protein [Intrasporangium sp.]MDN5797713.1 hypothetical protein [Intrasporangium sp.]